MKNNQIAVNMSKLSFRARALDASKPMPIFMSEELPDLPDYSAINRAVPQMPSGMEKEEECEHHLQRAICTGLIIPTPEVNDMADGEIYNKIYPPDYKMPRQMIHMQPVAMEQDIPDYDMDSEDEMWIKRNLKYDLTPLKFEEMMDRLEKGSGQTVMTLTEAKGLLKEDDDLTIAVYDYWLNKRLKLQRPLILNIRTEHRLGSVPNNPYVAFRRRTEKMQTRKNRKNDETSYEKMLKLRRDLSRAVILLELVKRREKTKREMLHLGVEVFEKRYQANDFSGQLLADVSALKVTRPAFAPLFPNQFGINSNSKFLNKDENLPRKEKRQYKKRKHKITGAANVMSLSRSVGGDHNSFSLPPPILLDVPTSDDEVDQHGTGAMPTTAVPGTHPSDEEHDGTDGPFAFRRKKGCYYHAPLSSLGNWPWSSREEGGFADLRFRYSRTRIGHTNQKDIGLARRRVGRGGRIILDRALPTYFLTSPDDTIVIPSEDNCAPSTAPWHFSPQTPPSSPDVDENQYVSDDTWVPHCIEYNEDLNVFMSLVQKNTDHGATVSPDPILSWPFNFSDDSIKDSVLVSEKTNGGKVSFEERSVDSVGSSQFRTDVQQPTSCSNTQASLVPVSSASTGTLQQLSISAPNVTLNSHVHQNTIQLTPRSQYLASRFPVLASRHRLSKNVSVSEDGLLNNINSSESLVLGCASNVNNNKIMCNNEVTIICESDIPGTFTVDLTKSDDKRTSESGANKLNSDNTNDIIYDDITLTDEIETFIKNLNEPSDCDKTQDSCNSALVSNSDVVQVPVCKSSEIGSFLCSGTESNLDIGALLGSNNMYPKGLSNVSSMSTVRAVSSESSKDKDAVPVSVAKVVSRSGLETLAIKRGTRPNTVGDANVSVNRTDEYASNLDKPVKFVTSGVSSLNSSEAKMGQNRGHGGNKNDTSLNQCNQALRTVTYTGNSYASNYINTSSSVGSLNLGAVTLVDRNILSIKSAEAQVVSGEVNENRSCSRSDEVNWPKSVDNGKVLNAKVVPISDHNKVEHSVVIPREAMSRKVSSAEVSENPITCVSNGDPSNINSELSVLKVSKVHSTVGRKKVEFESLDSERTVVIRTGISKGSSSLMRPRLSSAVSNDSAIVMSKGAEIQLVNSLNGPGSTESSNTTSLLKGTRLNSCYVALQSQSNAKFIKCQPQSVPSVSPSLQKKTLNKYVPVQTKRGDDSTNNK